MTKLHASDYDRATIAAGFVVMGRNREQLLRLQSDLVGSGTRKAIIGHVRAVLHEAGYTQTKIDPMSDEIVARLEHRIQRQLQLLDHTPTAEG